MMLNFRICLSLCFLICSTAVFAQEVAVVELSKEKIASYRAMLNQHRVVVTFIEHTLLQNGLPRMMRNLAMIESSFDKNTISTADAGGIWQFVEAHAADYGLKSEDRFDVYHSTQTAMKSLRNLYAKYGNWITVVAAYNCGEGTLRKAMEKAESDRYDDFYVYLPAETIKHVRKFMEACVVTNEIDLLVTDYKLSAFKQDEAVTTPVEQPLDPALISTPINGAYDLDIIAEELDIARLDLLSWNPNIEEDLQQGGTALLYLPVDRMPDFQLLKNSILNRSLQKNAAYD